jgi:SnoaL-like domain
MQATLGFMPKLYIMRPKEIVTQWVSTFNKADVNALAEFYHVNAVNHQVANQPVVGKKAIKQMFIDEFSKAEMVCIIENIFEDGEWAILEWKDPNGLRGCGFFQIQAGKIIFQRGYWDKLSFLRLHNLPIPIK